jgi:protein-disulfide isomerase
LSAASKLASVPLLALVLCASVSGAGCRDSNASSPAEPPAPSASAAAEVKDVTLPGVDTSPMTPRERHAFGQLVGELLAPCPDVPVPVAQCVLEKRACGACLQAAKWVAGAVRAGAPTDQIAHAYKERFDPSTLKTLPIAGSPTRGPEGAPVTIVEFADFECPHCAAAVPMIDEELKAHPDQIRLVYKSYSLPFHTRAEPAARAAFAAGQQGKFWEMEHILFERQQHLEDADLERYAKMLKLDVAQWKRDMDSPAVKAKIEADHKLGEDLKLKGTPTIYVNGRELDVEADESLDERVAAELGVPPTPPAAPSAAPTQPVPPSPAHP